MRVFKCVSGAVLALALAGCGGGGGGSSSPPPPPPAPPPVFGSVQVVSGNGQTGAVGVELTDQLVARVLDTSGNPMPGQVVAFVVAAGGGTVFAGTATSDSAGLVRERWTLGPTLVAQSVEIRANASTLAQFNATAVAGAAAAMESDSVTDNQSAQQTQPLAAPLAVRVHDTFGNAKAGVTVNWAPCADCGSVAPTSSVTDQNGEARTQWTLGLRIGSQSLVASSTGLTQVTFAAISLAAPPSAATAIVAVSGSGQSINQHARLTQPARVRVTDALGNGVPGVAVDFSSDPASVYITPYSWGTDADGYIQYSPYIHGAGAQQLVASTAGLPPVTFTINVAANAFRFDGFYACSGTVNGAPAGTPFQLAVAQDVLSGNWGDGAQPRPMSTPTFDSSNGAMTGVMHPTMGTTYQMSGNLAVDADEIGTGQGTFIAYFGGNPTGATGVWSCTRQ